MSNDAAFELTLVENNSKKEVDIKKLSKEEVDRLQKESYFYMGRILFKLKKNDIDDLSIIERALRKINKPNKYVVSAYDNDNDIFFDFAHTNSKKRALWIYENACKSFVNDTLNRINGFKLKDVDFIGLYENNQKIKVFDIYDKKRTLKKSS